MKIKKIKYGNNHSTLAPAEQTTTVMMVTIIIKIKNRIKNEKLKQKLKMKIKNGNHHSTLAPGQQTTQHKQHQSQL